jgi:hypothetical protein
MNESKFILLHVDNEDSKELLADAILNQGVERGVYFGTGFISELKEQFSYMKDRGYFTVGVIIDFKNPKNIEYLYKRHPNQTKEMKLIELKSEKPTEL